MHLLWAITYTYITAMVQCSTHNWAMSFISLSKCPSEHYTPHSDWNHWHQADRGHTKQGSNLILTPQARTRGPLACTANDILVKTFPRIIHFTMVNIHDILYYSIHTGISQQWYCVKHLEFVFSPNMTHKSCAMSCISLSMCRSERK